MRLPFSLVCLCCALPCAATTNAVLRRVADVRDAIDRKLDEVPFDVTARVIIPGVPNRRSFFATDGSGGEFFGVAPEIADLCPTNVGVIVHLSGVILYKPGGPQGAEMRRIDLLGQEPPPTAEPITPNDLFSDRFWNHLVSIEGLVHDAFRDEIDPGWVFLTLSCDGGVVYFAVFTEATTDAELDRLIGARVRVHGACIKERSNTRKRIGRIISANSMDAVTVLSPGLADRFDAPPLDKLHISRPSEPTALGRHRAVGHVIAVWRGESLLLKTDAGDTVRVDLAHGKPPRYGDRIETVGFPETDLYRINLSRAVWRPVSPRPFSPESARDLTVRQLLVDRQGRSRINARHHGHAVRLNGLVRSLPGVDSHDGRLYLEDDGFLIPVDASACPAALDGVTIGCTLEAIGTCVTETDNWRSGNVFPRIKELLLVVHTPDDIRILARPPWWTAGRLLSVIGALTVGLAFILVWNIALRRRAERRGRELAAEQLAHVTSELKVNERTRLAVELHDALSQTLTGVSMQIDTAAGLADGKIPTISKCLAIASRTIDACRMELRNTLWDLRSAALDEPSVDAAIRKTLCQNLAGVNLLVRFNVPRETFSDNTAHAVLKIIRELATNALRHGKATSLKIAGAIDGGNLLFSVRDNGCGFDPDLAPGISQGHFGLQGISERLERLNGKMKIESTLGKGAKVTVVLPIPRAEK